MKRFGLGIGLLASTAAEIEAKRCACEVTNPQGTCCLGNVGQAVKEVVAR